MRKHLNTIEIAGIVLCVLGILSAMSWGNMFGAWLCGIGMLLWAFVVVYKACHWNEFERQNRQNIILMLMAIAILFFQMILKRL